MDETKDFDKNANGDIPPSIVLSEAEFSNSLLKQGAIDRLIEDVTDCDGERVLIRPDISIKRALLNIAIPLIVWCVIFCSLYFALNENNVTIALSVSFGVLLLYILLRLRAIGIWCIRVYQRFAPAEVRLRCVYTPSCSEYAIQALQKYGVLFGTPKIFARLWRCHPPNGGEDPLK